MKLIPSFVLFQGSLHPSAYLNALMDIYPYDIDASLVQTLFHDTPYPHPALLHFIDYIRHLHKIWVASAEDEKTDLDAFILTMSSISQRNQSVLHVHQFDIDVIYHIVQSHFQQPYAQLSLEDVAFVNQILMRHPFHLFLHDQLSYPSIAYAKALPCRNLSIDANNYFGIGVNVGEMRGLVFIPKRAAFMISAIAALYSLSDTVTTPQFLLFYGYANEKDENLVYHDCTNECYIGVSSKRMPSYSILECSQMLQSLLCLKTLEKNDLTLSASMISIYDDEIGILFCGKDHFGKSAMLQTLIDTCKMEDISVQQIFDNYGTLHIMDDEVMATGSLIGALLDEKCRICSNNEQSATYHIRVSDERKNAYMLAPFTTYETIRRFHMVHVICLFDEQRTTNKIERITSLDLAKTYFQDLCWIKDDSIQTQFHQRMDALLQQVFFNNLLLLHIPVNQNRRNRGSNHQKISKMIMKEIEEWKNH